MSSATDVRLGWIGLGSMGLGMASNIQKYLRENKLPGLHYSNRTLSRGEPLDELGASACLSIAELVGKSDVIFVSVSNDEAVDAVIGDVIQSGSIEAKIVVDTTTVHPSTSAKVTEQLGSAGATYIAAPVFGATPLAEAGQLLVAVAGPKAAIDSILPFLKGVVARGVIEVGTEPSKALVLKTTGNFITAGLHYLLSEAHALASKTGLPAPTLESLIEQNFGAYSHGVSKRLTGGGYYPAEGQAPSSGLELGMKDVGHGLSVAREVGMELQVAELSMRAMEDAKRFGDERGRKMDSTSVFGVVRQKAGLDFETEVVKERDDGHKQVQ